MGVISIGGWEPPHLSYSTADSYRSCAKKLELTKILRLESIPGLAAIGGSAVHKATEMFDLNAFASGELDMLHTQEGEGEDEDE
jgi:hypothetical protein